MDPSLSRKTIDQIVDELAPDAERGPKKAGPFGQTEEVFMPDAAAAITYVYYENVTVSMPGKDVSHASTYTAAGIQWNNRQCRTTR